MGLSSVVTTLEKEVKALNFFNKFETTNAFKSGRLEGVTCCEGGFRRLRSTSSMWCGA
jgi:hypothetical protein